MSVSQPLNTDAIEGTFKSTPTALFRVHVPKPPLSDFIAMFWYYEATAIAPSAKERLLPSGTVEFVIRLAKDSTQVFNAGDLTKSETFFGSIVTGPQAKYFILDKSEQDTLMGIHFKPGGAFPFFGVPANELQDQHVSLSDLWGARAEDLRSQLLEAGTVEARFFTLERYMLEAVSRPLVRHSAVHFALRRFCSSADVTAVGDIADEVNISQRRLSQIFAEQVGLAPKLYHRVARFQNVLHILQRRSEKNVDWAELALSCGYFDQAHFNHDFQSLSGLTPTTYLSRRTEHLNHVPID